MSHDFFCYSPNRTCKPNVLPSPNVAGVISVGHTGMAGTFERLPYLTEGFDQEVIRVVCDVIEDFPIIGVHHSARSDDSTQP